MTIFSARGACVLALLAVLCVTACSAQGSSISFASLFGVGNSNSSTSTSESGFGGLLSSLRSATSTLRDNLQERASRIAGNVVRYVVTRSNDNEICYVILGCFSLESPWVSLQRPFPSPASPEDIKVRFYLHTRNAPGRFNLTALRVEDLSASDFQPTRTTFFLTHGFQNSGNETWMSDLKDAILSKVDGNVFIVDWGLGAFDLNYLKAASSTRIVGREIAILGHYLIDDLGASAADFHLMGHSLGAHISGYAARNITGVARVTAFDPAGPGFEALPRLVRLSKYVADFVDVLHTNAKPITMLGFGMMHPIGHVDFYLNGGAEQPGCTSPQVDKPTGLLDLISIPAIFVGELVSCSHSRSYKYFTEAINSTDCRMWGHKLSVARNRILWVKGLASEVKHTASACSSGHCTPIGLDTPSYPGRGTFSVATGAAKPFCLQEYSNEGQSLEELESLGLLD